MGSQISPLETGLKLSVVIPTLNEAAVLGETLAALQACRDRIEIIVVDGGSLDDTLLVARGLADRIITNEPGRARQMNAGASLATGKTLLFLHADTLLPKDFHQLIGNALSQTGSLWGRFDIQFSPSTPTLNLIAWMINKRSRLTRICTGDQAIFVRSSIFRDFGRFTEIPLMEDIELTSRLRYLTPPACIETRAVTSSRRWIEKGTLRTVMLMWRLRLLYWLGVPAERLANLYYPNRR